METATLPKLEVMDEIEQEARQLVLTSQNIAVISHEDYLFAAEQFRFVREKKSYVKKLFEEPKRAADQAHKAIVAAEKKLLDPLLRAEALYGDKVVAWEREQQRKEREEAERLLREAEEKARREAEEIRLKQEEEKRAIAALLEQSGFKEEASQVLEKKEPEPMPTPEAFIPPPVIQVERAQGMHIRKTYKSEVYDFLKLVQAVAAGEKSLDYLLPNQSKLDKQAAALGEEFNVPGCRAVEILKPVTRTK